VLFTYGDAPMEMTWLDYFAQVKSNRPRESFHAAFRALVEARFVVRLQHELCLLSANTLKPGFLAKCEQERAPSGCSARTLELMVRVGLL
jgi:hypothetical protein